MINKSKHKDLFLIFLTEFFKIYSKTDCKLQYALEYDQSSSGPMIYSILSQDKNIAYQTNLISKNKKKDLYNNFLLNFKKNIDKNLISNDDLKFFTRSEFSKKLIMPIFYNMSNKGIRSLLNKIISNNNIYKTLNYSEKKEKVTLIVQYINELLNKNYNETINFQKTLVNICKVLTNQNLPIVFYTLDGSLIKYKYLKFEIKYGSIKKSNFKRKTYKIYVPIKDNDKNIISSRHHATFPPNYIQSIDAAVCRMIIYTFYFITGKILEPLHDSFRVSVTDLKLLNLIIKYVYIYNFLNENFHKYKIGLNIEKKTVELNSTYYSKYTEYFYFEDLKKNDLIYNYFIKHSLVALDNKNDMLKFYKENIKIDNKFNKKIINKIIKSYFLFYF